MSSKVENIPLAIRARMLEAMLTAAVDTQLNGKEINSFTLLGLHTDANCVVGVDEAGQPLADPRIIAQKLGFGVSTAGAALTKLEQRGYIHWDRGWSRAGRKPTKGSVGQIRIILPSSEPLN